MRLPFSSHKHEEVDGETKDQPTPDDASERSTAHSTSTPIDTPATSYSSYSSTNDRETRRAGMYKLSVVDNSGTFLPPSPPDTGVENGQRAWSLHRKSANKSHERIATNDGPFIISRESFEGYRRSFDIGGTSPILGPRLSLDSTPSNRNISISSRTESRLRVSSIPGKVEERAPTDAPFEDIKLEDDRPSRKNLLSRFGFGARVPKRKDGVSGEELQNIEIDD